MPLHRDATYVNLHPPLGASLDTSDQPLNLLESAYAMHWRNHNARDALLVDTSFANSTRVRLGNSTDPTYLVLPGASIVEADRAIFPVRGSDPSEPGTGVALYSKDVAGVDHLFARVDDGTIYQLTPPASGSFDPEDIALADNTADALDIYEGANKYLTVATTNGSEAIAFGNATTNPSYSWLGSGAWTVGGGVGTSGQVLTSNGAGVAPTWQTVSGGSFDPTAITLADNTSGALRAVEGSNDYLRVNTTDAAESIILGNATTNPSFSLLGTGALLWNAARQITLLDNTADVFRLMEGSNEYFGVATTNGSEAVRFGNATTNPSFTFSGSGALTLPTGHITIPDNTATAFRVREAANNYLAVTTTNSSESMSFGNATTNPAFSFLGSGALTLPTGGISIPDNTATAFRVREAANNYLTVNTTDASERIVLGNATTNPVFEFAGSGHVAMAGNIVVGNFSVLPSGTGGIRIGSKSSGTDTGNTNIVIGASTGNNSGSRFVSISAGGRTGNASTDSITIQSIGGAGATGTRAIAIGGAATASGGDAIALGYAASAGQAYSICLGRGATPNAANQFVVGGDGHPTTQFFLGEGVTESGGFVATDVTIQPTEGTGTNRNGLPLTLYGGRGTGTGNGASPTNGSLTLATYPSTGSSGTTQHTAHPRVRVRADGVTLLASHGTMSTATERDEALHFQTGNATLTTAGTWYTLMTITPELATGQYHGIVHVTGKDVGSGGLAVMALDFDIASGTAALRAYTVMTDTFTFLETRATASGGSMLIEARNTTNSGDKAVGWCQWQGTW